MRLLQAVGVMLALVGGGFLVAPGVTRWVLRVTLGMKAAPHEATRVAAWGLVLLGLAIVAIGHLAS